MSKKLDSTAYGGVKGSDYVPYETDPKLKQNENSMLIIIIGVILATIFAASTAYSGMKAGLTVAAGIPGVIVGSAILKLARKNSIFGPTFLQGMSSAGESAASGIIFVLPAILVIGADFTFLEAALAGVGGAVLGIAVASTVHNYLIVEEHGKLMYPESMAISETLVVMDSGGETLKFMGIGFGLGGIFTFFSEAFANLCNNVISFTGKGEYKWYFGLEVNPMLLGLGFIVGTDVAIFLLAGGFLSKFLVAPLMAYFAVLLPDTIVSWNDGVTPINSMSLGALNANYVKYIGAGAMLGGGFIGAIKLIPVIVSSLKETLGGNKGSDKSSNVQKYILLAGILLILVTSILISKSNITMMLVGGILSVIFILIFVIVAGRLTGTVGTSNLPVSGMTIASLVVLTITFVLLGFTSPENNRSLLLFGTLIVTGIAMSGGYLQSQKVSFIIGGSKDKMQLNFIISAIVGSLAVVGIIILLKPQISLRGDDMTFGIPQAELMATLTQGILQGNLPWTMIYTGIALAIFLFLLKLPIMTIAVGFYLPIETCAIIFVGAIIRFIVEKIVKDKEELEVRVSNGISLSSGLVAGSAIIGIIGVVVLSFSPQFAQEPAGFFDTTAFACIQLLVLIALVFYSIAIKRVKK